MSVYTRVEAADVAAFLSDYAVGELLDLQGIADGIENTNYFVTTRGGRFVLTLFERHAEVELEYFLELMVTLADHGLACPRPIMADDGSYLRRLAQRPAALVERLAGKAVTEPSVRAVRGGRRGAGAHPPHRPPRAPAAHQRARPGLVAGDRRRPARRA